MCTDSYGQLGHGDAVSDARLRVVEALRGQRVAKVACGDTHVLALTIVGDVWAWGGGEDGQLGLPEEESCDARCCLPRRLSILKTSGRDVCHVAAGLVHSVALPPRPSAAYAVHARVAALEEQLQTVRVCCALFNAYSVMKQLSLTHCLSGAYFTMIKSALITFFWRPEGMQAPSTRRDLTLNTVRQVKQQLKNSREEALAHQREGLVTQHKLQHAQHQIAKLTQLLHAKSLSAEGVLGGAVSVPAVGDVHADAGERAAGDKRTEVAEVGVQTEGILLAPTALRAHGMRVQQQLARSWPHQQTPDSECHVAAGNVADNAIADAPPRADGGTGTERAGDTGGIGTGIKTRVSARSQVMPCVTSCVHEQAACESERGREREGSKKEKGERKDLHVPSMNPFMIHPSMHCIFSHAHIHARMRLDRCCNGPSGMQPLAHRMMKRTVGPAAMLAAVVSGPRRFLMMCRYMYVSLSFCPSICFQCSLHPCMHAVMLTHAHADGML